MKVNIKGTILDAPIYDGVGYANAEDVLTAFGVPLLVDDESGVLKIGLRRFAEVLGQPHTYTRPDDMFWIASRPLPPLPAEPVGSDKRPWHPIMAPIMGGPGDRRADLLERIIQQFQVERNPRYKAGQQGHGETYCNIFLWDVTCAMGAEIPHWVVGNGEPSAPGRGRELDANATIDWLRKRGPDFGWRPVKADGSLAAANNGMPVVAAWLNIGGIGHVAMVRPGAADPVRGVPIAQAGARNGDDMFLVDGFGSKAAGAVEYYVHF